MGHIRRLFGGSIMGIDLFPFYARNILQLQQWFQDIQRNLETENYNSGDWLTAPNITSLTGTPTVTHYYHKFGKQVDIIVVINGTSQTSTSKIDNVPYKAKEYGIVDNVVDALK